MKRTFKKVLLSTALFTSLAFTSSNVYAKGELIILSLPNLSSPFEVFLSKSASSYAKTLDIKFLVADGQSSSSKQVSDLESAITQGAKGIVLSPNDVNAIASSVEDLLSEKIQVVTVDRSVNASKPVSHFGADNYQGGYNVAKEVIAKFPNGANIVLITGQPGSSSNIERVRGVKDALKSKPGYKIVVEQTGNWLRSEGLNIVQNVIPTLSKKPDVVFAVNDAMALGAIEALKSLGYKPGEITVTGFDSTPEALVAVQQGWLFATADQKASYAIKNAMKQLVDNIRSGVKITGLTYLPEVITIKNIKDAERYGEIKSK